MKSAEEISRWYASECPHFVGERCGGCVRCVVDLLSQAREEVREECARIAEGESHKNGECFDCHAESAERIRALDLK